MSAWLASEWQHLPLSLCHLGARITRVSYPKWQMAFSFFLFTFESFYIISQFYTLTSTHTHMHTHMLSAHILLHYLFLPLPSSLFLLRNVPPVILFSLYVLLHLIRFTCISMGVGVIKLVQDNLIVATRLKNTTSPLLATIDCLELLGVVGGGAWGFMNFSLIHDGMLMGPGRVMYRVLLLLSVPGVSN